MKKNKAAFACVVAALSATVGCSTVNVVVNPPEAAEGGANSVASLDTTLADTNAVTHSVARGSVIVVVNMNAAKDISPDTTATLMK